MSNQLITGYKQSLPKRIAKFVLQMKRLGFEFYVTGSGKTINVRVRNRQRCGYINDTVKGMDGILGYNFAAFGDGKNSCPEKLVQRMQRMFCERYQCDEKDFNYYEHPSGANRGLRYLVVTNPKIAKRVLLADEIEALTNEMEHDYVVYLLSLLG